MIKFQVKWYNSYKPYELSLEDIAVAKLYYNGEAYLHKTDKNNCPVIYFRMHYHKRIINTDDNIKMYLYVFERALEV